VRPTCRNKYEIKSKLMTIRIGTAPVSWGIMEVATSWGRTQTFDSVLDEMVSAGYSGTELGPWGFLPTDPKRLMAELSRRARVLQWRKEMDCARQRGVPRLNC
jgi:hypothetical protein